MSLSTDRALEMLDARNGGGEVECLAVDEQADFVADDDQRCVCLPVRGEQFVNFVIDEGLKTLFGVSFGVRSALDSSKN